MRDEHVRRYNVPLINEVAEIVTDEWFTIYDIVLYAHDVYHDDRLTRVSNNHQYYDALQYPLNFSTWQEGYYFRLLQINLITGLSLPMNDETIKLFLYDTTHTYIHI